MKQEILNAMCGQEGKFDLIMRGTKEPETTSIRRKVFVALKANGHTMREISDYFGMSYCAVWTGLKEELGYIRKDTFKEISDALIQDLTNSIGDNKDALYLELKKIGYTQVLIAKYFGVSEKTVSRGIKDFSYSQAFEERRKEIVKF